MHTSPDSGTKDPTLAGRSDGNRLMQSSTDVGRPSILVPMTFLRAALLVGVVVAVLVSVTTVGGAERNDTVYFHALDVTARVDGVAGLRVEPLSDEEALAADLHLPGDALVTVTAEDDVVLDLPEAEAALPVVVHMATGSVIRQGHELLGAGNAAVLSIEVPREPVPVGPNASVHPPLPLGELPVTIPVRSSDGERGALVVTLTVRPQVGDELGVPGTEDIADRRFPRPDVGEAIPEMLADGRPVWVVGLPDRVAVVDARSPHRASGVVGWCPSMPGFIDSPGASQFDPAGAYRGGPAPWGLTPYEVHVDGDVVTVTRRLEPLPRLPVPPPPPLQRSGDGVAVGTPCEFDATKATAANDAEQIIEDYRSTPGWVQHDLSSWPTLGSRSNGWFRADTEDHDIPGPWEGEVLVERRHGRIIDVAPPPGVAAFVQAPEPT